MYLLHHSDDVLNTVSETPDEVSRRDPHELDERRLKYRVQLHSTAVPPYAVPLDLKARIARAEELEALVNGRTTSFASYTAVFLETRNYSFWGRHIPVCDIKRAYLSESVAVEACTTFTHTETHV